MIAELARELWQATVAASAAVVVVVCLRQWLRRSFGAVAAYWSWLLVPIAIAAVWLPAPMQQALSASPSVIGAGEILVPTPGVVASRFDPVDLLMSCWALGTTVTLLLFAVRQRRFNRSISRRSHDAFDTVEGHGPAVVGWWRPRIVLPIDFHERYSPEEQALVLAHERAHLLRGDIHAQTLATGLRCLFWFNPLIHRAANLFRFDQELACDATVLAAHPGERRRYGEAILKTQLAEFGLPIGCHWQSSHPLKDRIAMLRNPLPARGRKIRGASLIAMLVLAGSYAAWAAQPTVPGAVPEAALTAPFVTRLVASDDVSAPKYPAAAKQAGLRGNVTLAILVATDGSIRDARVVKSTPAGIFDQATLEAARKWKLTPALRNDQPIESWMRMQVEFAPEAGAAEAADGRRPGKIPEAMATAPTRTLSPDGDGLRSRIGMIEVNSAPPVLDQASNPPPRYPAEALARKQSGMVILDVLVDARGAVKQTRIHSSEPAGVFDQAAIEAVRQWKYQPGTRSGVSSEYWIRLPIQFDPGV